MRKDDMLARRTSYNEPRSAMPFNQYLPNKSNLMAYVPTPLRKKAAERQEYRKSWSTATSPIGGERPFRPDSEESQPAPPDIILRRDNDFLKCQQEGESDSEDKEQEQRLPDIEKDDLASRKARMNQFKPKVPHNTFLPMPCSQRDEEKWENIKKATHLVTRSSLYRQQGVTSSSASSSPVDQYRQVTPVVMTTVTVATKECPQTTRKCLQLSKREMEKEEQEEEAAKESFPDLEKDDMMTRRALAIHRQRATAASQFFPVPASRQAWPSVASRDGKPRRRPSWLDDDLPPIYSHTASVSDDAESVSMIDMRCEDEAILQPHSKARHEHLHDLHNRLLEEDNKWQDDLVRWKNRRRSASQDLIKKEEERKKVERLMSGDRDLSKRRKSIKTYREIVEEKERRERELHEAYRNASSPEEAEAILRRYTQRFTVSEAVLERLEMPKFLERSVSVDSDTPSSPTKEASNPMKYLRQKSLPAPKFTATVQATISVEPQPQVSPPQTSPTRTVSTKAVPMLSPKPYSQPKSTQPALKSFKVDGMVRVNGETGEAFNGAEDERESASVKISLTKSQVIESADGANTSPVDTVIHTSPFKSQENAMVNTSPLESKVDASAAKLPEQPGTHISPVNSEEDTFGKDPAPAKPTLLPTDLRRENLVTEKQDKKETETSQKETLAQSQQNDQKLLSDNNQSAVSEFQFIPDASWNNKQLCTKQPEEFWRKTASLDRNWSQTSVTGGMKRSGSYENIGTTPSKSSPCSPNLQTQSPNRSISGKKVCSSCAQPLGKGAAMIIETLGLYFHHSGFKCGICKGQLGDTSTGTDVRIRNGILNCTECYIRSRSECCSAECCTPLLSGTV
ncbi:UNVERIFIED_CONTAM: hypothetical protein FKN15_033974 [Acipenser sinensis]